MTSNYVIMALNLHSVWEQNSQYSFICSFNSNW